MESKSGGKKQTKQLILWIIALAIGARYARHRMA